MSKCISQNNDKPCQAYAQRGSEYCIAHDPAQAVNMAEARKRGGFNSRRKWRGVPDVKAPKTVQEVRDMLAEMMAALMRGDLDPQVGATVNQSVQTWLKTMELDGAAQSRDESGSVQEWEEKLAQLPLEEFRPKDKATVDETSNEPTDSLPVPIETTAADHHSPQQTSPSVPVETIQGPPIPQPLRPVPLVSWQGHVIQNTSPDDANSLRGSTIGGIAD